LVASPAGWWSVSSTETVRSLSVLLSVSLSLLASLSVETLPSLLLSVSNR
jgi:predicted acyltransferase